jgi:hypothetical protein
VKDYDSRVLAATFSARVQLAKLPVHEAIQQAEREWHATQAWVQSESRREGSFLWFCAEFELDPSAVRRAIKEKKQ